MTTAPLALQTTKGSNPGPTLRPPPLNKIRNTKDAISAGPKQDFLLYATTTHPSTIKAKIKITKLCFCLSPTGF